MDPELQITAEALSGETVPAICTETRAFHTTENRPQSQQYRHSEHSLAQACPSTEYPQGFAPSPLHTGVVITSVSVVEPLLFRRPNTTQQLGASQQTNHWHSQSKENQRWLFIASALHPLCAADVAALRYDTVMAAISPGRNYDPE